MGVFTKVSRAGSAASSCSGDGSLAAGGGGDSPLISDSMHSMIWAPLACFEVSGCSFVWVLRLCLFCCSLHSYSALPRAAGAPSEGEHHFRAQRNPASACPHQPPGTNQIISLPLVFPRSLPGEAGERRGTSLRFQSAGAIPAIRLARM